MIYVGIDDTDVAGSRGTNQLARALVAALSAEFRCLRIIRHQLLEDPRVPCTTKNGSASILLEAIGSGGKEGDRSIISAGAFGDKMTPVAEKWTSPRPPRERLLGGLAETCRALMLSDFIEGSDPGLCVASSVPLAVSDFGRRCKAEMVSRAQAEQLAQQHGIFLEGLGGTLDGMIGALAAVGLAAIGDDGRVVQIAQWPDDLSGVQSIDSLTQRGVVVRDYANGEPVPCGLVDVGKHLRPNRRAGRDVLFVEKTDQTNHQTFKALRFP